MNIRIISGEFGGRIIEGSGTSRTHPMGERIRNSLFNIIGTEIKDARVLDAFAGSGSLALESLSRGAGYAVLIEKDRVAQNIIQNNIKKLDVVNNTKLVKSPVASWINTYKDEPFDIVFADPPYNDLQLSTVMQLLGMLKPNGLMVLSYPGRGEVPTDLRIVVVDNRRFGDAALAFYRKKDA